MVGPSRAFRPIAAAILGLTPLAVPAQQTPVASEPLARSVWDGAYTEEQSKRGESVYRRECALCHGAGLQGWEEGKPLTGAAFTSNWNGVTLGELFDRIKISMPPLNPGLLTRQQNADVISFILRANNFPIGKTELPSAPERLRLIRFEATKP